MLQGTQSSVVLAGAGKWPSIGADALLAMHSTAPAESKAKPASDDTFLSSLRFFPPRSFLGLIPVSVHHKNDAVHIPPIRRPASSCSSLHCISARSIDLGKRAPGSSGMCLTRLCSSS